MIAAMRQVMQSFICIQYYLVHTPPSYHNKQALYHMLLLLLCCLGLLIMFSKLMSYSPLLHVMGPCVSCCCPEVQSSFLFRLPFRKPMGLGSISLPAASSWRDRESLSMRPNMGASIIIHTRHLGFFSVLG